MGSAFSRSVRINENPRAIAYPHLTISFKCLWAHSFRFMFQFGRIDTCLFTCKLPLTHPAALSVTPNRLLLFPIVVTKLYSPLSLPLCLILSLCLLLFFLSVSTSRIVYWLLNRRLLYCRIYVTNTLACQNLACTYSFYSKCYKCWLKFL